jgi:hypothetical protein
VAIVSADAVNFLLLLGLPVVLVSLLLLTFMLLLPYLLLTLLLMAFLLSKIHPLLLAFLDDAGILLLLSLFYCWNYWNLLLLNFLDVACILLLLTFLDVASVSDVVGVLLMMPFWIFAGFPAVAGVSGCTWRSPVADNSGCYSTPKLSLAALRTI